MDRFTIVMNGMISTNLNVKLTILLSVTEDSSSKFLIYGVYNYSDFLTAIGLYIGFSQILPALNNVFCCQTCIFVWIYGPYIDRPQLRVVLISFRNVACTILSFTFWCAYRIQSSIQHTHIRHGGFNSTPSRPQKSKKGTTYKINYSQRSWYFFCFHKILSKQTFQLLKFCSACQNVIAICFVMYFLGMSASITSMSE